MKKDVPVVKVLSETAGEINIRVKYKKWQVC
jgi:hypothetical protein